MAARWINIGSGCQQSQATTAMCAARENVKARDGIPAPISRVCDLRNIEHLLWTQQTAEPLLSNYLSGLRQEVQSGAHESIKTAWAKFTANSENNSECFLTSSQTRMNTGEIENYDQNNSE